MMTKLCCLLGGVVLGLGITGALFVGLCWFGSDTLKGVLDG